MPDLDDYISTLEHHLRRIAYYTKDNPFLRGLGATRQGPETLSELRAILSGQLKATDWIISDTGQRALSEIRVGCVPRDVQLTPGLDEHSVGVESVHGFIDAPRVIWMLSLAWCIEAGRAIDLALASYIFGFRLDPNFCDAPSNSGRVFRDVGSSYSRWLGKRELDEEPDRDKIYAIATIDMKAFHYSTRALPSEILASTRWTKASAKQSDLSRELTAILDQVHRRYAEQLTLTQPRGKTEDGAVALPVGLPSSQILANVIISNAIEDLVTNTQVSGLYAYADDLMIVTRELPLLGEDPTGYLERIELLRADANSEFSLLVSEETQTLASFAIEPKKTTIAYARAMTSGPDSDREQPEQSFILPDVGTDSTPETDWSGRMRTVLRSPYKRDRVPRQIANELQTLTNEIRTGLSSEFALSPFEELLAALDQGSLLAIRSYWTQLFACGIRAGGAEIINTLSRQFVNILGAIELPPGSSEDLRSAVLRGLSAHWAQSLAEALAAFEQSGALLSEYFDKVTLADATGIPVMELQHRAHTLRQRSIINDYLVSIPLTEYFDKQGLLFGASKPAGQSRPVGDKLALLRQGIGYSSRFVPIHEISIALHSWVSPGNAKWIHELFDIFASQPLLHQRYARDLKARCRTILGTGKGSRRTPRIEDYMLRVALPSLQVDDRQLGAILNGDQITMAEINRKSITLVAKIANSARSRHADLLVLPEWSVSSGQIPSLFALAAREQMAVICGEAPSVTGSTYSNRVWTAIPLRDSLGHRACLVPPPREKIHLSPVEAAEIKTFGIQHAPARPRVPVYFWRGIGLASLVCYEFADIALRGRLRRNADLITVSSLNKDWRYFEAVQESTTRDNYCVTICVNTGKFPGTQIVRPTKSDRSVAASVHGSADPSVITRSIDFLPVVAARARNLKPADESGFLPPQDDLKLGDYRALPPTF